MTHAIGLPFLCRLALKEDLFRSWKKEALENVRTNHICADQHFLQQGQYSSGIHYEGYSGKTRQRSLF
jgi:hypothetical protein